MGGRESTFTGPLVERLTRREREILALLEGDLTSREIAEKLTIALSSAKWHIQQIYGKLGVNARREAIARARELGLLLPGPSFLSEPEPHPRHNLPAPLTRFIGRQAVMAECAQLVIEHRLVTLTGPGGSGKTRLGLEVGQRVVEAFQDGAWFVDLTPLHEPALIPGVVLAAFPSGLLPGGASSRKELETLVKALQAKSLLLILDNCEHLVEACARLAEALLRACPNLHLLATSREGLSMAGEQAYGVPSLDLPDPGQLPPVGEIAQFEGVQLFVERARSIVRTFELTEQNAPSVVNICQRLDGMPLAIELAAARLNVLTPEQIAGRLDNAFYLLTAGSRTTLPRHQTLRAAIAWSFQLLTEQEKALLRKLSVFSGGWSLEAAEAVGQEGLDPLSKLVDKSLVMKEDRHGQARFRMLETIRQFAASQLWAVEQEGQAASARHRDWFLQFAEQAAPHLGAQAQARWLDLLELEHDNLRAALHWSLEQQETEAALRLAGALGGFWNTHSHNQEAYRWTKRALDLAENDPNIRRSGLWAGGIIGFFGSVLTTGADIAAILPRMEEAYQICLRQEDLFFTVGALNALGTAEANLGHWEAAEKYFREGVEVLHQNQDNALYGFFLLCLGVTVAARGDHAAGRAYFQKSLELCNLHGDRQYSLYALLFNTEDLFLQGQVKTALELSHQALLSTEEMGHRHVLPRCLVNLARATMLQGDYARARDWARKIDPVEKALGGNGKGTLIILTMIDLYDSQLEAARAKGLEALALARQEKDLYELFNTLFKACLNLARISLKRLDLDNARKYVGEAEKLYPEIVWHKDDATYLLVQTLAHTARLEGQCQEARRLYLENLRQMLKAGHLLYAPESLEGLAMAEVEEGQLVLAAHLLGRAHALREQMGTPLPPCSQEAYAVYQARLQQAAPPEELERLWSEGQNMTVEEALAEALKIGERQPL